MELTMKRAFSAVSAAAMLSLSAGSLAAIEDTWDFRSGSANKSVSDNGMSTNVTGWYANYYSTMYNADYAIRHYDSGMGLNRWQQSDGQHTVDNQGHDEFLIFQFDEAVSLQNVSFGWVEYDADITVMYKGDEADGTTGDLQGSDLNSLTGTSKGYSLLGDFEYDGGWFQGGSTNTVTTSVASVSNPATGPAIYSKVWLIGAHLGTLFDGSSAFDGYSDKFKLATLTTERKSPDGEVPAPMTLFLMAIGLLPLVRRARR